MSGECNGDDKTVTKLSLFWPLSVLGVITEFKTVVSISHTYVCVWERKCLISEIALNG